MRERAVVVGAVASEPRSIALWDAVRAHFHAVEQPMEFVLHSTYDRLTDALLGGQVDVAWSSPVAHLRVQRRIHGARVGIVARDTDRDQRGVWLGRPEAGHQRLRDLAGKHLAVGGRDHAWARLLALAALRAEGVDLSGVRLRVADQQPGRHGDTPRDEEEILEQVRTGEVDAGAVSEGLWLQVALDRQLVVLGRTAPSDGWVFDALPTLPSALREGFERAMSAVTSGEAGGRRILELAGARGFVPARHDAYEPLRHAMDEQTAW
jgi:phosphonate transport system substrate-binding protein